MSRKVCVWIILNFEYYGGILLYKELIIIGWILELK